MLQELLYTFFMLRTALSIKLGCSIGSDQMYVSQLIEINMLSDTLVIYIYNMFIFLLKYLDTIVDAIQLA